MFVIFNTIELSFYTVIVKISCNIGIPPFNKLQVQHYFRSERIVSTNIIECLQHYIAGAFPYRAYTFNIILCCAVKKLCGKGIAAKIHLVTYFIGINVFGFQIGISPAHIVSIFPGNKGLQKPSPRSVDASAVAGHKLVCFIELIRKVQGGEIIPTVYAIVLTAIVQVNITISIFCTETQLVSEVIQFTFGQTVHGMYISGVGYIVAVL